MFVHRVIWNVKGSMNEAEAIAKEFWERFPPPHSVRILTPWLYPTDVLAVELEFVSLGEYEEFWRGFHANPEIIAWRSETREGRHEVFGGATEEMWQVRE